jgi:hypothetical protein
VIHGQCLCGDVQFTLKRVVGPFELCHCNRCRRVSGSAFMAAVGVRRDDFAWVRGRDRIRTFDAPLLKEPPPYRVCFCSQCGSPVPDPESNEPWFEVPAGLLEGPLDLHPDKHIFIEHKSCWFEITDDLPQYDETALAEHRARVSST